MINGLLDAWKSIKNAAYDNSLVINRLNYARNILLTLAEIDHSLNQLCNGLRNLASDISTIYNNINSLSSKIVTPILIDSPDLRTILNII